MPGDFCLVAAPIPNALTNHAASREGIDAHNAVGVDLCGW